MRHPLQWVKQLGIRIAKWNIGGFFVETSGGNVGADSVSMVLVWKM